MTDRQAAAMEGTAFMDGGLGDQGGGVPSLGSWVGVDDFVTIVYSGSLLLLLLMVSGDQFLLGLHTRFHADEKDWKVKRIELVR